MVSKIIYCHPYLGKIPILTIQYFSKGLVQPPTRKTMGWFSTSPISSMYGIFAYIHHRNQPNVGIYTIHGWYGSGDGHQRFATPQVARLGNSICHSSVMNVWSRHGQWQVLLDSLGCRRKSSDKMMGLKTKGNTFKRHC